ncbi:HEAT repeat domain-containing protein [Phytohabitans flavus]|uniref:HEAT repeat domain-containing protein n=1 Tax=Phytohabitans flavus TaxID=1076124 RepID=UPI0036438908
MHRTFLEFLAADELAAAANRTGDLNEVDRFLWRREANGPWRWTPAAAEMLCLLAGCLQTPELLLRRLLASEQQLRPLFPYLGLLACKMLKETTAVPAELRGKVMEAATTSIVAAFPQTGSRDLVDALPLDGLVAALSHNIDDVRVHAVHALARNSSAVATAALLDALDNSSSRVTHVAAQALIGKAEPAIAERLPERLSGDWSRSGCLLGMTVLESISSPWFAWHFAPTQSELAAASEQGSYAIHALQEHDWFITRLLGRTLVDRRREPVRDGMVVRVGEAVPNAVLFVFADLGEPGGGALVLARPYHPEDSLLPGVDVTGLEPPSAIQIEQVDGTRPDLEARTDEELVALLDDDELAIRIAAGIALGGDRRGGEPHRRPSTRSAAGSARRRSSAFSRRPRTTAISAPTSSSTTKSQLRGRSARCRIRRDGTWNGQPPRNPPRPPSGSRRSRLSPRQTQCDRCSPPTSPWTTRCRCRHAGGRSNGWLRRRISPRSWMRWTSTPSTSGTQP